MNLLKSFFTSYLIKSPENKTHNKITFSKMQNMLNLPEEVCYLIILFLELHMNFY